MTEAKSDKNYTQKQKNACVYLHMNIIEHILPSFKMNNICNNIHLLSITLNIII